MLPIQREVALVMRKMLVVVGLWVGAAGLCAAAEAPAGASAYDKAFALLKQGDQDAAEDAIDRALRSEPDNQRLLFFQAACARSRWSKSEALRLFRRVQQLDRSAPEAECAALMIALDFGILREGPADSRDLALGITGEVSADYRDTFAALEKLQQSHPEDPLILWMAAVACREIGKRGGEKFYSELGAKYYEGLLKILDPGPVMLHQTCANILTEELGRYEEALVHRKIAIQQHPSAWTYQGMANTLTELGRFAEADEYYTKSVRCAPDNPTYWSSWAWSLEEREEYQKAFNLYQRIARLAPGDPQPYRSMAWLSEKMNRPDDAKRYKAIVEAMENRR